jgi:F-type H+-transporting ATPase subunit epsilon
LAGDHMLEAEVLTPEGEVFSGELQMISTRTTVGEVGILANHIPMIARLLPAELRLHKSDSEVETYAQGEGWLEVFANQVRVLVSEVKSVDELDVSDLKRRLEDAEQAASEAEDGSAAAEQAERQRARAEAFIKIAENG